MSRIIFVFPVCGFMAPVANLEMRFVLIKNQYCISVHLLVFFYGFIEFLLLVSFLSLQDSISALAHDLNYPALRKNKNIDVFLNRCKSLQCVW